MEISCVTMAKGLQQPERDVHASLCNGMVRFRAQHGHTQEAERWMARLRRGEATVETCLGPELRPFDIDLR